jgi:hypothetical protein
MQANSAEHFPMDAASPILGATAGQVDGISLADPQAKETTQQTAEPTSFHGTFSSYMEMYAEASRVAHYLDAHRSWFPRCAHPMQSEPIGENGYALTVGKFGSFGYEVEPKVGLDLLPQYEGIYRIETIPVPGYEPPGYEVDFQAAMQLVEADPEPALFSAQNQKLLPPKMTRVEWELDLKVTVQFPRFIHALPTSMIQTTGDRLLNQIVRQVSRCLTHKVQEDFHQAIGVPFPKKRRKAL